MLYNVILYCIILCYIILYDIIWYNQTIMYMYIYIYVYVSVCICMYVYLYIHITHILHIIHMMCIIPYLLKGGLSIHSFPMISSLSTKIDGLQSIKNHLPRIDKWLDSYPLVNIQLRWKDPPFFMGKSIKSTISTGSCSIAMLNYQRVFQIVEHDKIKRVVQHVSKSENVLESLKNRLKNV